MRRGRPTAYSLARLGGAEPRWVSIDHCHYQNQLKIIMIILKKIMIIFMLAEPHWVIIVMIANAFVTVITMTTIHINHHHHYCHFCD